MPKKCINKDNLNKRETHHEKDNGGNIQSNGVFYRAVPMTKVPDPYSPTEGNGTGSQTPQGSRCQAPSP